MVSQMQQYQLSLIGKIVSSDVFTGCLNLTIDKAPTIQAKVLYFEITDAIIDETRGSAQQSELIFLAQRCPEIVNTNLQKYLIEVVEIVL